jgi:hypothetical protein
MLRSAENFLAKHGRHAGCGTADAPTTDVPLLRAEYQALLEGSSGLGPTEVTPPPPPCHCLVFVFVGVFSASVAVAVSPQHTCTCVSTHGVLRPCVGGQIEICMRPLAGPFGDIDPVVEVRHQVSTPTPLAAQSRSARHAPLLAPPCH